jgi:hypothetical protein
LICTWDLTLTQEDIVNGFISGKLKIKNYFKYQK